MTIYDEEGNAILTVEVDDNSYRYRAIMGDYNLTLYYSLAEHVEIPVGSYCEYQNETYTLERPEAFKMKHSRLFEYTVTFESGIAKAKIWKFRNPVDGRLKFSYTAYPVEHLQMFVDNMNARDSDGDWAVGECVDGVEVCISYNHAYCYDALGQMADELETEFEFVGKTVSLHKIEYNKDTPLALSYGRGNGFKPDIGRANYGDNPPIEILYTQGGTDNIDASTYGNSALLLPISQTIGYDGTYFEDEDGYDADNARTYVTDELGLSIRRSDKELTNQAEDSLDCSDVYPKRVGTVSSVIQDEDNDYFDIVDEDIPETLDYEDYLLDGETMTVIFQSGMLAGKEFDVAYDHDDRRFEISPTEIDGITMPSTSSGYYPKVGDTYAVFHCALPDAYICDDDTKSGASWDMFREGVRYLYENEDTQFTFTGELDGIWAAQDWENIGGKIKLGGYVSFTDERFQSEATLLRIIGIKDYINKPHSPQLELSNAIVTGNFSTQLTQLESTEVLIEDNLREALQYTKRRFRDAKETISMLQESLLDNFTAAIQPITVETMSLLVGDESLQFRFVDSKTNPSVVSHTITWDNDAKKLTAEEGILQHMTLGISSISSEHDASEYMFWDIDAYESATLDDTTQAYYFYAKVSKTDETGVFLLSASAIAIEAEDGYYHLLVGILNSEYDEDRSFITLYGYTEILPGRITTDKIVSSDGNSYLDLVNNALKLGDKLKYNVDGAGKLILQGTLVQSSSGDTSELACYRGTYDADTTYYEGDEVVYTDSSDNTSLYRCILSCTGKAPTSTTYWTVQAAGTSGSDGVSVESITEYYGISASSTTEPTSWSSTSIPTPTATYPYLWNYEVINYTDGTSTTLSAHVVGNYASDGEDGADGSDGSDGVGIESVVDYYARSTSNSTTPSSWSTACPTLTTTYKYLWNYEVVTYTDGTTSKTTAHVVGVYGDTGADGEDGSDGVYINQSVSAYVHKYGNSETMTVTFTVYKGGDEIPFSETAQPNTWRYWTSSLDENTDGTVEYVFSSSEELTDKCQMVIRIFGDTITEYVDYTRYVYITTFVDGVDGTDGTSPAAVYRGEYDDDATYYGTTTRRDIVYNSDDSTYYIALTSVGGSFTGVDPTDDDYWESFGASFDSVATSLLLAENANIAGFIFRNSRLESQLCTDGTIYTGDTDEDPYIYLDGTNGVASFSGGKNKFNADGSASLANGKMTIDSSGNVTMSTLTATGATIQGLLYAYSGIKYRTLVRTVSASGSYVTKATSYLFSSLSSVTFYSTSAYYAYNIYFSTATSTTSSAKRFAVRLPAVSAVASGWTINYINMTPYQMWIFPYSGDDVTIRLGIDNTEASDEDGFYIGAWHAAQVVYTTYWYVVNYYDLEEMNGHVYSTY